MWGLLTEALTWRRGWSYLLNFRVVVEADSGLNLEDRETVADESAVVDRGPLRVGLTTVEALSVFSLKLQLLEDQV